MAEHSDTSGTAAVTDRRPVPRGVLPRGVQTWLMGALAIGMLLIILLAGQPNSATPKGRPAATAQATDSDRVREYQERLRALDAQAAQDARSAVAEEGTRARSPEKATDQRPVDPALAERQRRDYESLFASNVVLSRRPDSQRPDRGADSSPNVDAPSSGRPEPSIDDIAAAVVRATAGTTSGVPIAPVRNESPAGVSVERPSGAVGRPATTGPISATGPLHRLPEGTFIDAVLTNRLDGAAAAPVVCLVTTPVYSHAGTQILVPAGARVLGETKPVQAIGETRLAVSFHRLQMPDGSSVALDQFRGLNAIGDSGLRDQVNQHYWSMFGAAAAVGLVSGLAQYVGTAGISGSEGDRTVVIAGSGADAMAQTTMQVMSRFLNRLPTITIREGHRVKVYVTSDLELPAWAPSRVAGPSAGGSK